MPTGPTHPRARFLEPRRTANTDGTARNHGAARAFRVAARGATEDRGERLLKAANREFAPITDPSAKLTTAADAQQAYDRSESIATLISGPLEKTQVLAQPGRSYLAAGRAAGAA